MSVEQAFTLRGHGASVTASDSIVCGEKTLFVSGDSDGWLVWWDIGLKRPVAKWKGHDANIITIQMMDSTRFLSHSRDSSVKIWHFDSLQLQPVLPKFEIPTNSLNFCNVAYRHPYLLTPASVNSNNFDIYLLEESEEYELSRIISNCDPYELYTRHSGIIEIPSDSNGARSGFGILMKLGFIDAMTVFLGFESGHILTVHIDFPPAISSTSSTKTLTDRTLINKDPKLTLTYANSLHSPNPIISLTGSNILISGSTNKKIVAHDYKNNTVIHEHKLNHAGISCISKYSNGYVIGYWNGVLEGILLGSKEPFFVINREVPRVNAIDSNTTSVNDPSKDMKSSIKLTSLCVIEPATGSNTGKSYKQLIKSKRTGISDGPLIMVGYEDGAIIAFK